MSLAKRHHLVPKFYLAGFSDHEGRIGVLDLKTGKVITSHIRDAGLESHFYSIPANYSRDQDMYENYLSGHEGQAAAAFKQLFAGVWPLEANSRMAIATWIAYQHFRVRARRTSQEQTQAMLIRLLVKFGDRKSVRAWIEAGEGGPISDQAFEWELEDLGKGSGPDLQMDAMSQISLMENLVPLAEQLVCEARWAVVSFERKSLFTCDHPTSLFAPPNHPDNLGIGIATAAGWRIPLGRRLGLEVKYGDSDPDLRVPGTTMSANLFNAHVAFEARRFIYFHPEDRELVGNAESAFRDREIEQIDEKLFEATHAEGYSSRDLPRYTGEQSGPSMTLTDIPWPIPGRVNSRPEGL